MSWSAGSILGPAVGGPLLGWHPLLVWPIAAVVCLFSAAGCLALERRLPERVRRTPRPEPVTLAPPAPALVAPGQEPRYRSSEAAPPRTANTRTLWPDPASAATPAGRTGSRRVLALHLAEHALRLDQARLACVDLLAVDEDHHGVDLVLLRRVWRPRRTRRSGRPSRAPARECLLPDLDRPAAARDDQLDPAARLDRRRDAAPRSSSREPSGRTTKTETSLRPSWSEPSGTIASNLVTPPWS